MTTQNTTAATANVTPAPILFYGVPEGCSFGSIVALEWLGKPYRLSRIEMPEQVSGEAYRRLNPLGETPTLMTPQGHLISESMAIQNHIAAQGIDRGLGFAQGTPEFDRLNQMLAFLNTSFFGAFSPLWYALEHSAEGSAEQQLLVAHGHAKVAHAHAKLEQLIGDGPWLLGEQRSAADAYFAGIARWNDFHRVLKRSDYPRLDALYRRLQQDPAVQFAHAIEAQQPTQGSDALVDQLSLEQALELLPADR